MPGRAIVMVMVLMSVCVCVYTHTHALGQLLDIEYEFTLYVMVIRRLPCLTSVI